MSKLFIVLFSLVFSLGAQAKGLSCHQAHLVEEHVAEVLTQKQSKKFMKATEPDRNSTLAARVEKKFALVTETSDRLLQRFKSGIELAIPGFKLLNRDAQVKGKRNVTWTAYSNRFKLVLADGRKLTAKIRVRKYGLIDIAKEVSKANFEVLEWMKDSSFFEFKIENPDYDNSVLKPRMLIKDADANLLLDPQITKLQIAEIFARTKSLNPKKTAEEQQTIDETIFYMLQAIRGLHKKGSLFQPEFETIYERVSYVIPVTAKDTGITYEIQITVDGDIIAYSILNQRSADIYEHSPEAVAVNEIKIPIPLIEQYIKTGQVDQIPGLAIVLDFISTLEFNSLKNFQSNSGKLFHLRREIKSLTESRQ